MFDDEVEVCYHPGGFFNMRPSDLLPDDPNDRYKPVLCPNCHDRLPSSQTTGYLCQDVQRSCLRELTAPRRLIFIEAATGNCAGRCGSRLNLSERRQHTLICKSCVQKYEPMVRDLLRMIEEKQIARHSPIDVGEGPQGICGNPRCAEIFMEGESYPFPDDSQYGLAVICPRCYVTATMVRLGRPYLERQREGLQRAGVNLDMGEVDFDSVISQSTTSEEESLPRSEPGS